MKNRQFITIFLACLAFSCSTREQFELKLTKNENLSNGVAFTITFLDSVFKIHNSLPVKIGVNPHGRNIAVWMDPGTDTSGFLWLDRDLDGIVDFGDSTPIIKNRPSSKIYVSSRENPVCTLPFLVTWKGDENENYFNWSAHYVFEGNIDYNGMKIPVRLSDINSDGLINITDAHLLKPVDRIQLTELMIKRNPRMETSTNHAFRLGFPKGFRMIFILKVDPFLADFCFQSQSDKSRLIQNR